MSEEQKKDFFSSFDSPYQTQPPKGSAEGPLNYGKVTGLPYDMNDPMGVMPETAKQHNIGPKGSKDDTGH